MLFLAVLDGCDDFVLERRELDRHSDVIPVLDTALLVGELVEFALPVAAILQELVLDVLEVTHNSPDLGPLIELLVDLIGCLSGPESYGDLGHLHVQVQVVHFVHVVLLVVLAVRIVRVKVFFHVLWLRLYWQLLVDPQHQFVLPFANPAHGLVLFLFVVLFVLD